MVVKVDLTVTGEEKMHCAGCEGRVRFALSRLPGVQSVIADAKTQAISVVINPEQVTSDQVQERLNVAGFDTEIVKI